MQVLMYVLVIRSKLCATGNVVCLLLEKLLFMMQPQVLTKWNGLTSISQENTPSKLCVRTLQTALGIEAHLCIRDIGISQPMEKQMSPLFSLSAVAG